MTTPLQPTIRTQRELEDLWRRLARRFPVQEPLLQLILIGPDDRPLPQVIEIDDVDRPPPDADDQRNLSHFLRDMLDHLLPGARVAMMRSRPGPDHVIPLDRRWARSLYDACRAGGVPCETMHLATPRRVFPMPWDELTELDAAAG